MKITPNLSANNKSEALTRPVDNIVHLRWMDCVLSVENLLVPTITMVPGCVTTAEGSFAGVSSNLQMERQCSVAHSNVDIASPAGI